MSDVTQTPLTMLTIQEVAERVGRHEVTPSDLLDASLKRIEALATQELHLVAPSQGDAIVIERVQPADPPGKSVVARR